MMVTSSVQLLIVNVRKREEEDQEQECKKRGKGSWWCHVAWLEWKSGLGAFNNKSKEQRVSLSPAMSERNPVLWPRRIRICVCLSLSTTSFSLYRTTSTNNNNNNNNNSYLFFSLYLFICLSPPLSLSSYLSSPSCIHPCPNTLFCIPSFPFFSFLSCNPSPCFYLIHSPRWYACQFPSFALAFRFLLEFAFWGFVFFGLLFLFMFNFTWLFCFVCVWESLDS